MLKIDDNLLKDLGLASLDPADRKALLDQLLETLELRVGMKLASQLSEQELDDFETLLPKDTDSVDIRQNKEKAALNWLESHFPEYRQVVAKELDTLKVEVRRDAAKIINAVQGNST